VELFKPFEIEIVRIERSIMNLYKRGAVYWFELVYKGSRYRESTKVKNRRAAEDIAAAFRLALAKGDVGIVERKKLPTFEIAMKAFLKWTSQEHQTAKGTADRYRYSSSALLKFFRDAQLNRVTPQEVERFKTSRAAETVTVRGKTKDKRKDTGVKVRPATVNRELACLRAMFNYIAKEHPDLRNPVSQVKFLAEANQQDRVLTFAEQRAYLNAASPMLAAVAGLILETGMRPEEVFTLQARQVRLDDRFLKIEKGKTPAARRRIDLTDRAVVVLKTRMAAAASLKTPYLFPCDTDVKRPLPGIQSSHSRALKDSNVAAFRPYDLRHTWATRAAEAGIDLVTLASMLGHSRIQMVMRYAHPTQSHRTAALEKLVAHNKIREEAEISALPQPKLADQKKVVGAN
jgi:integrase